MITEVLAQAAGPISVVDHSGALGELAKTGLLGTLLALAIWGIIAQRREIRELNKESRDRENSTAETGAKLASALEGMARATEERNRGTDRLTEAINRQADATKASLSLAEAQHARILDRQAATDKVVSALAEALRTAEARRGRS